MSKIIMVNKRNISFNKSFASHEKSKYLHKDKNGDIKPENITLKSGDKYIFICNNLECGHEFISSPQNIVSLGRWCYYCCIPSKYLCDDVNCTKCFEKSFACHEKSIYWSTKNELQPNQVFKNCTSKFWFDCPECHHSFESVLSTIFNGSWCPYCSNPPKQLCGKDDCNHCNNNSFASHEKAKYWNYELNGDIKPFNIFTTNRNKYYFNCGECGHILHSVLSEITAKNRWCAYCSHSKLCDNKDCKKCFEASFESDAKVIMWSAKNGYITPRQVFKSSGKKYWLMCNDCLHEFQATLSCITKNENKTDKYCPICNSNMFCDNLECKICFEKSFASHPKAIHFNNELNNGLIPRKLSKSSNEKYWFNCNCGHKFETGLNTIVSGSWCPYCAFPTSKLCNNDNCVDCLNKSFVNNSNAKFLEDKTLNIRQIYKGSQTKYNFICEKGHKFSMTISAVTSGCFCPKCVNKTERKLYEELIKIYKDLIFQYKPKWCKNELNGRCLPYDFAIEKNKIIIELDGLQHFVQVSNWNSPENIQQRDKYKMKQANDNGYSVIRILQEDVYHDKYNWLVELKENIEKVIIEKKIQNIYICKKNEYSVYNMENLGNIDIQDIQENINDIVITEDEVIDNIDNIKEI
jgi:hypothetical protein